MELPKHHDLQTPMSAVDLRYRITETLLMHNPGATAKHIIADAIVLFEHITGAASAAPPTQDDGASEGYAEQAADRAAAGK